MAFGDPKPACRWADLVILAFELNHVVVRGNGKLPAFVDDLRTMVQRIREATAAGILLISPRRMLSRDNDAVPGVYREYVESMMRVHLDGTLRAFAAQVRAVAREQGVALADVYEAWSRLEDSGVYITAMLSNGLNHPEKSHDIAVRLLMPLVEKSQSEVTD